MTRQPDRYGSFSALLEHEIEGVDYRIRMEDRSSRVAIIAPHGGLVEPATSQIALGIAADSFSFYCFEGLGADRLHHELHITSEHFDEPTALSLVFPIIDHRRRSWSNGQGRSANKLGRRP